MSEARRRLPEDLENVAPGPRLASLLASVDRMALSGKDRVRLLQARHRLVAHLQAELYADMYAIARDEPVAPDGEPVDAPGGEPPEPYPWASTEISFALRWTYTAAGVRLEQARRMCEDLPAVAEALRNGLIDVPKALLLSDEVSGLVPEMARRIVDRLLDKAPEMTTGQLRAKLRRLVIAADPAAALDRAKVGAAGRRVTINQEPTNLASLSGNDLLPHRVAASFERLTAIARAAKAAGDPRRIDELRADAMMDLLVGDGIAAGGRITHGGLEQLPQRNDRADTVVSSSGSFDANELGGGDVGGEDGENRSGQVGRAGSSARVIAGNANSRHPSDAADCSGIGRPHQRAHADTPPGQIDGDITVDPDHEKLRPYWLAGFDQLLATRPTTCQGPDCHRRQDTGLQDACLQDAGAGDAGVQDAGAGDASARDVDARDAYMRGAMPAPRRGVVDLHMSLTTLLGLDDLPAELAGYGPLLADIARQVVAQQPDLQLRFSVYNELDSLLVHGTTAARPYTSSTSVRSAPPRPQLKPARRPAQRLAGPPGRAPLSAGPPEQAWPPALSGRRTTRRTARRPTAAVAALVRARNRTCAAPGCRVPSLRCELDHILAWADHGESEPGNLEPVCPRHHRFKHTPGTELVAFTPGTYGWQTPLGMQYLSRPDPPIYDDHRYIHPPQPGDD